MINVLKDLEEKVPAIEGNGREIKWTVLNKKIIRKFAYNDRKCLCGKNVVARKTFHVEIEQVTRALSQSITNFSRFLILP